MPRPSTEPAGGWAAPRWAAPVTLLLLVAGLAVSAYLTVEHFTASSSLLCPDTGVVNCAKVTTSAQSRLIGVPVAVLGLVFFAAMTALHLPAAWRSGNRWLRRARVAGWAGGVGMVAWLVYAEFALIGAICLWCTVVHVLTVTLFAVTAAATALGTAGIDDDLDDDLDDDFGDDFDDLDDDLAGEPADGELEDERPTG